MTKLLTEEFPKAAARLTRQTEVILSPLHGVAEKKIITDRIFRRLDMHYQGAHADADLMVGALAATLLRMPLDSKRETMALDYIASHIDKLPADKAADAAFIAARHTQYLPWAWEMTRARRTTTPEEQESRRTLERETTANWVRQMGRLDSETWNKKMAEFSGAIAACTHMDRVKEGMISPERRDPMRAALGSQRLVAA